MTENNAEIKLSHLNDPREDFIEMGESGKSQEDSDYARSFDLATNGYLWKACYSGKELTFDICHGLTDGQGMMKFVETVLEAYYGLNISYQMEKDSDPFREIYSRTADALPVRKQEKGFGPKELPHRNIKEPAKLHYISLETKELLRAAKKIETTPAALLLPIISKAIRASIPENAKNRNVNFSVTADFRKTMGMECCRNFIGQFPITYTDHFEQLNMETLGTVYRTLMDLYLQPENITKYCTDMVEEMDFVIDKLPRQLQKVVLKISTPSARGETNGYLTYLGKFSYNKKLIEHIEDMHIVVYPDNGYCAMCAIDFDGTMKISFTNCYKTEAIIPNLLKILEENHITANAEDRGWHKQMKLKI